MIKSHGKWHIVMEKSWKFIIRFLWEPCTCERIQESCRRAWKDGFNDTDREKEYVRMKDSPRNESFADGSVGASVRLMVRGDVCP